MERSKYTPAELPSKWAELLTLIPGYDPIATAGECIFDADAAQTALDFFPDHLRHTEDSFRTKAGDPFILEPWQQAPTANLFGWKRPDGTRRYRECLYYTPRKQGKTMWVAGVSLCVLYLDKEVGQQNYIAAGDRDQAGYVFRQARGMIERNPQLSRLVHVYGGNAQAGQSKSIVKNSDQSFLRVICAVGDAAHGGGTHLGIIDELHVQRSRDLVDVILSSRGARRQPIIIYTTTAGTAGPTICNEIHTLACHVRDGIRSLPYFLPVVYETKQQDDWTDEKTWAKCNPNLGVSVSLEFLREEFAKAKENLAYENTFRRLYLNQITEQAVRAVPMDRWDMCGQTPVDPATLIGCECYGGLDLASTSDVAAFVLVFQSGEGYFVLPFFWVPADNAKTRERRDRVTYETWGRAGLLTLTEGNVIDYDVIKRDILELRERYNIKEISVDRWNATQLVTQLQNEGLTVFLFGQGMASMTSPTKELLRLVNGGLLWHGGNPVLRWMAANMATQTDAANNLKPAKDKSAEKIDGMVALVMALGRAMQEEGASWYQPGALSGKA